MANVAYEKGFIRATLSGDHADLIWQVMQKAGCTPGEALGWLLRAVASDVDSGAWDGSTASQTDAQGVLVMETNLDRLVPFKAGDLVMVSHSPFQNKGQPIVGTVHSIDPERARLRLTAGSLKRMNIADPCAEYNYVCPTSSLTEL